MKKSGKLIPSLSPDIEFNVFSVRNFPAYNEYISENRETAAGKIALSRESRGLVNYIDGERTISMIRNYVMAESGKWFDPEDVIEYFRMLKEIGYIDY